jgi:hypothetical protein
MIPAQNVFVVKNKADYLALQRHAAENTTTVSFAERIREYNTLSDQPRSLVVNVSDY